MITFKIKIKNYASTIIKSHILFFFVFFFQIEITHENYPILTYWIYLKMHNFAHLYDKCKEIEVTIYKLIHLIQSFEFCTYQIYTFYKKKIL